MRFLSEICRHISDIRRAWTEAIDRQPLHRRLLETIVWLATLPDGGPEAGFFRDRRAIEW